MIDPRTVDELRWHDELVAGLSEEGHDRACEVILTGLHTPQAARTRGIVAQGILAYLAAVEPGANSAASPKPSSDSGAAPKSEQEEHGLALADALAGPSTVTDKGHLSWALRVLADLQARGWLHRHLPEGVGNSIPPKLLAQARLSDREPE